MLLSGEVNMSIREIVEMLVGQEFNGNHDTFGAVTTKQQIEQQPVSNGRRRTYTNLTSYEIGFLLAYQYFSKKIAARKNLVNIDTKTISYASYSEIIKFLSGLDRDNYYQAWIDAKQSLMADEQLYVSK